ncbi:hypothetical protein SDC9_182093 [bioreactor metagenome]|uniref:Uncharacterized protein n=1 Tax=bioreactor metagenome TaxID=1076179 RepID=A0A645H927_9ZZZZ
MIDIIGGFGRCKKVICRSKTAPVRAIHGNGVLVANRILWQAYLVRQGEKHIDRRHGIRAYGLGPLAQLPQQPQKRQGRAQCVSIRRFVGDDGEAVPLLNKGAKAIDLLLARHGDYSFSISSCVSLPRFT